MGTFVSTWETLGVSFEMSILVDNSSIRAIASLERPFGAVMAALCLGNG